ncbi:hypothetical protein H257_04385 [Aphanomyces astaci]|uniref:Matrin-type domain-containing protein n=1 Tax=Aphanomyces astaci TaxID=112090 RepID=W4GXJ7_APHAT|nr:hypothetical protein H257_04385 [Aphanomyces astaci]ETV83739.1 hypothetical protein H257_04385 [Aphanomyces astaci]|eukprot:XP_009827169.1 hypothetical protein H257_04385 [Aphanomyces astaci]
MGQSRFTCEYCQKSFTDTSESRRRHTRGRLHKMKVKEWYDRFQRPRTSVSSMPWTTVVSSTSGTTNDSSAQPLLLPPSMVPAPPQVFSHHGLADWG